MIGRVGHPFHGEAYALLIAAHRHLPNWQLPGEEHVGIPVLRGDGWYHRTCCRVDEAKTPFQFHHLFKYVEPLTLWESNVLTTPLQTLVPVPNRGRLRSSWWFGSGTYLHEKHIHLLQVPCTLVPDMMVSSIWSHTTQYLEDDSTGRRIYKWAWGERYDLAFWTPTPNPSPESSSSPNLTVPALVGFVLLTPVPKHWPDLSYLLSDPFPSVQSAVSTSDSLVQSTAGEFPTWNWESSNNKED